MSMSDTSEYDRKIIGLITEHQTELTAYIRTLMPTAEGVQDILQDANIVLWEKRDTLRDINAFRAWAYKICYYKMCHHMKKTMPSKNVTLSPEVMESLANEYHLESEEDINLSTLETCLAKLTPDDHKLVMSHYQKKSSLAKYAEKIGISVGKLKHALIRIRTNLKHCVEQELEA
jgi:RNA polymerase sigma-70 factor (ECF subfamily)